MRLVRRPCRKLAHSRCEGSAGTCFCMCHWEVVLGRKYGPPFPRPVPDGTVKVYRGGWEPAGPQSHVIVRGLAVIADPRMWRRRSGGWLEERVLAWKVWRRAKERGLT